MTNVKLLFEELLNSSVKLDQEYWDEQNKNIGEMRQGFEEERRRMIPSQELLNSRFNL